MPAIRRSHVQIPGWKTPNGALACSGMELGRRLIKSGANLVSDVTWVVLQDGTKYAPFVASRDFNWRLIRHECKGIMAKILFR
jgi:hypothetical protein